MSIVAGTSLATRFPVASIPWRNVRRCPQAVAAIARAIPLSATCAAPMRSHQSTDKRRHAEHEPIGPYLARQHQQIPLAIAAQNKRLVPPAKHELTISMPVRSSSSLLEGPVGMYFRPVAALIYPVSLWSFHVSVVSAYETGGGATAALAAATIHLPRHSSCQFQSCLQWRRRSGGSPLSTATGRAEVQARNQRKARHIRSMTWSG